MTKARRPTIYLTGALKRLYGQRKGQLADLFADRESIGTDMAHLAAVLVMFDPAADVDAIPVLRPYKPRRGHWTRTALDILKAANRPLRAYELARMVIARLDMAQSREVQFSIACALQASLARLEREDLVSVTGRPRRWSIPSL